MTALPPPTPGTNDFPGDWAQPSPAEDAHLGLPIPAPPKPFWWPTFLKELGFDPCDYNSWPYGFGDPEGDEPEHGIFTSDIDWCLQPDPGTLDRAGDFDALELLFYYVTKKYDTGDSEAEPRRILEMALRLFLHLATTPHANGAFDPRINGLSHTDIFAASLDTAVIWERG